MKLEKHVAAATALILCVALAGCGAGANQKKLLSYFPSEEGFVWEYEGTQDYAQTMGIDSIHKASSGEVTYSISGDIVASGVDDPYADADADADAESGWESGDELELELGSFAQELPEEQEQETEPELELEPALGDGLSLGLDTFNTAKTRRVLEMEYEFTKTSVIEKIIDADGLPHRFSQLEVLRMPVKKGKTWSFQAPDWTDIKAEVIETGKDADKIDYVKIRYEAEVNGESYIETRLFKKGLGMVEFTSVGPDGAEFVYRLIGN